MSISCNRIAALSIPFALAGAIATAAHAQDSAQRDTLDLGSINEIRALQRNGPVTLDVRPVDPTSSALDWTHNGVQLLEPMGTDTAPLMPADAFPMPSNRATLHDDQDGDAGLSNTFFIRSVPEGTTDFSTPLQPQAALVDTWTGQVLTGEGPSPEARSSVTAWTDTVNDGIAAPAN